MSEQLYSIQEQTLIDIGDALRRHHGETKIVIEEVQEPIVEVLQSSGATGFDNIGSTELGAKCLPVRIDGASSIKVRLTYNTQAVITTSTIQLAAGYYESTGTFPTAGTTDYSGTSTEIAETIFEGTDSVTMNIKGSILVYAAYYAEITGLDADGNEICKWVEKEVEVENTYTSSEMAIGIDNIIVPPEEAFMISGLCGYRFANGGWDWFLRIYGDKLSTNDITPANHMFHQSGIESVVFEINLRDGMNVDVRSIFDGSKIKKAPYINGSVSYISSCFSGCDRLTYIPEDWASHIDWSYLQSYAYAGMNAVFQYCRSIKNIPTSLISKLWGTGTSGTCVPYGGMFNDCYALSDANEIGVHMGTLTSNRFNSMFSCCGRLKSITFAVQSNGSPYAAQWKAQTIDLSVAVGYEGDPSYISNYYSGITADKEVIDDATYQALKDDPDWYTEDVAFSRYNHDSAVATINSLPDTSAYLATAGGTNTIKFKGAAGSKTDGGAINTLTEAEIAVATAKGWTVTFA